MPAVVYILFGAVLAVAASTAAGKLLLHRIALPLDRAEQYLFSFLTGAALLSLLVFLLCAAGLASKGVFLFAGLAILAAAYRVRDRAIPHATAATPLPRLWKVLLLAAGGAYTILYFFNALAPEISPDGSTYHLGLVARYLREHGFHRLTNDLHASLSQAIEMLFLFAFAFGRHSAAALVHFAFLLALGAMVLLYARRFRLLPAGACAAIFVFASPIAGVDGSSAYIDVAVACIAFGVFYLLEIWDAERAPALAIPIGLLAGFAYAAKFTAAVALPYALAFVAWRSWRKRQPFLKPALTIAACALLMMAPWMAKNWIWVQNPFSPFLNSVFPNPFIQVGFERELSRHMRHYEGIHSYLELPWAVAVDGRLSGFLGPLYLLTPIGLLALRFREGRRLLLAAAIFGSTYFLNIGARFLIPAAPFLALALAMVFARWRAVAVALAVLHAVVSWPALTSLYCDAGSWRLHDIPIRAALRLEPEDRYLAAHVANYNMARLIERTVPPGGRILTFSQVAEAYTARDILVVFQSARNKILGEILWTPLVEPYMPDRMFEFRFPQEPLRGIRVVQTASAPAGEWSITELEMARDGAEVARGSGWSLHAEPNPWELPLAFDHRLVTRWRTWLPIEPGQFAQVNFSKPEPIDKVAVQCTRDQTGIRLKLEGQDASGRWKTLSEAPHKTAIAPVTDLRRMAGEELKARGVGYLLVFGSDLGSEDFRLRQQEWGIAQVGELGPDRLYRIGL